MEFSCSSLLDTISQEPRQALKFGGAPAVCIGLFGKVNNKSYENLLLTYRLPKGELLAAHLTKKVLLLTDGVLMTDKAIYINPDGCPENVSNRIPWCELHKYFIIRADNTAATILYQPGGVRYTLLRQTLIDTVSGKELTEFIQKMQAGILASKPELKSERAKQFQALRQECEGRLTADALDVEQESALKNLFSEFAFAEEAAGILAIHYARLYPQRKYLSLIEEFSQHLSSEFCEKLTALWSDIAKELIETIEAEHCPFSTGFLDTVYKNYRPSFGYSAEEARLMGLLCTRLKKWPDIEEIIEVLRRFDLKDDINNLYFSRFSDANRQMLEVLHTIQADQNPFGGSMDTYRDSMGLTPFHYALICENSKARAAFVASKKYPEIPEEQHTAFDVDIYDLFTLAVYRNLPYRDLRIIVLRTNEGAKRLKSAVTSLRAEGIAVTAVDIFLQCALNAANSGYGGDFTQEQYESVASGSEKSCGARNQARIKIEAAEEDLNVYIADVIRAAEQRIQAWRASKCPEVRYLLRLYSDPEYLERMLCNNGTDVLYCTSNGFFYMAPEGEIELDYLPGGADTQEAPVDVEKPFGDSWFSPNAHSDPAALKKEFRELAKKYHPDVSNEALATVIFKEISAEYDLLQDV